MSEPDSDKATKFELFSIPGRQAFPYRTSSSGEVVDPRANLQPPTSVSWRLARNLQRYL